MVRILYTVYSGWKFDINIIFEAAPNKGTTILYLFSKTNIIVMQSSISEVEV